MQALQITGIALVAVVIILFFLWLRFQRKQEQASERDGVQEVTILVKGAYDPNTITVKAGLPLVIHFSRQEESSCSRFVIFDSLKIREDLKPFAVTDVEFTPAAPGEINFTCDMGMYQGKIIITQ